MFELIESILKSGDEVRIKHNSDKRHFTHEITVIKRGASQGYRRILWNADTNSVFRDYSIERPKKKVAKPPTQVIHVCNVADINHAKLVKLINNGLRGCIIAHGDITKQWIGSASKRVASGIMSHLRDTAKSESDNRER